MRFIVIFILFVHIGCYPAAQQVGNKPQQIKAERKLLQRSPVVIKSPTDYLKREAEKGEFDPRPKIVTIDEKAGKYELRWIGYDGKKKIIKYQRHDALDAVVEARTEKNSDGKFTYKYLVKNLPTSPAYLSGFMVQTLSSDVKDERLPTINEIWIGHMSQDIPEFSIGLWRHFSLLNKTLPRIESGKNIEFSLVSSALSGIVECRAMAGEYTLKGVGEDMPSELEMALPGYEVEAKGYTIGPIDRLATLTKSERAKYILENLPKFQEAGWMSDGTAKIYEKILKREDLAGTSEQAKKDFEKEFITSEVLCIIEGLNK